MALALACNTYDRTIPLQDGSVRPEGLDLNFIPMLPGELFRRQARFAEFDVSEFSLSTHVLLTGRGDRRMVGIPVFPSRMFRHSNIFVRRDGPVRSPTDLAGRRIGVMEYQQTATVWIRGILDDEYGVSVEGVEWYVGTYEGTARHTPRIEIELPERIRVREAPEGRSLTAMLLASELDALIGARPPAAFGDGRGEIVRLIDDYETVELDYFRRTGIYPIMHTVVLRREIHERAPWVAGSLFKAFVEAKRTGLSRLAWPGAVYCALPWLGANLARVRETMGDDPFVYGLEANRPILEKFLSYALAQGLLAAPIAPEDLFAPQTHGLVDAVESGAGH